MIFHGKHFACFGGVAGPNTNKDMKDVLNASLYSFEAVSSVLNHPFDE